MVSKRFTACVSLAALLLVSVFASGIGVTAQEAPTKPIPAATPDEHVSPQFAIVPVGDHPEGYFDDVEVEPGDSVDLSVAVINSGTIPVSLRTYQVNALNSVNGGYVSDVKNAKPVGANAWVDYPTRSLELEPGTQREIAFTVSVPTDATAGQHISGLVVETQDPLPIPGTDSLDHTLAYAITVGILVPGELTHSFELGEPEFMEAAGIRRLRVPVANTGNYLVRPNGELTVATSTGERVLVSPVQMGSVYGGLSTTIDVILPDQMAAGDYMVALSLTDEESGTSASLEHVVATLPEPLDPSGLYVDAVTVEPNAEPIAFANVAVTINNGGQQIPATNVMLHVLHDGKEVESFPLATNQLLPNGETELTARYIPAEVWKSGTYKFKIDVSAVDPQGGTESILATIDVGDEIVVP